MPQSDRLPQKRMAFANQKGGVGKTTSCVNLAASLAASQRRVLLVDMDPQGNATMGSGIDKYGLTYSINDVLQKRCDPETAIMTSEAGFDVLPANRDLTEAEVHLLEAEQGPIRLREALEPLKGYEFILIDCPPSLSQLTVNALVAAYSVLIPMQCEYYALEGLAGLMQTIDQIRASINPKLYVEGVLRTMYDGRNRLSNEVSEQLYKHFGERVYQTVIPRNVRLAEAPSHGLPALQYDKRSQGATAYLVLAGEMLRKYSQSTHQVA